MCFKGFPSACRGVTNYSSYSSFISNHERESICPSCGKAQRPEKGWILGEMVIGRCGHKYQYLGLGPMTDIEKRIRQRKYSHER